jgi:putative FmdB family regulatory protein
MPIYAYKCESCGFAKDVLQKMSDSPLEVCPSCSQASFKKQLTAAGFQLKGSGWYATDFKGGSSGAPSDPAAPDKGAAATEATPPTTKADTAPAVSTPSPPSGA